MTLKEAVVQALLHCNRKGGASVVEHTDGTWHYEWGDLAPYDDRVACILTTFRHVSDLGGKGFTDTTEAGIRTMVNERMV